MAARCPQRYDDSSISGIRALVAAAFLTAGPQPSPVRTWMCPSSWSAPRDKDESSVLHHTPLAQLGKHLVLKGLKHKDPEPTFQLALATPASCGSALINSSALPFHSSQPDTFSIGTLKGHLIQPLADGAEGRQFLIWHLHPALCAITFSGHHGLSAASHPTSGRWALFPSLQHAAAVPAFRRVSCSAHA